MMSALQDESSYQRSYTPPSSGGGFFVLSPASATHHGGASSSMPPPPPPPPPPSGGTTNPPTVLLHMMTPVPSGEELDAYTQHLTVTTNTPGSRRITPPPSHEEMEDEDWNVLCKKIDSCVRLGTQFFEYPKQELFTTPPTSGSIDDDELTGTKVFLGGMRFEVVQMGRHLIRWLLAAACGVTLSANRILIHRKSKSGKLPAPTGCASVYVANEADVKRLIDMNQRIFCGEKGIHVASSAEEMNELIASKNILDVTDGRVRGPTHPMIIERAYSGTTTPNTSPPPTPTGSTDSLADLAGVSPSNSLQGSFTDAARAALTTPQPVVDHPLYRRYEGDTKAQPGIVSETSQSLTNPTELFVGGLCYEATRTFVAWMFTTLMQVKLHPLNVTLYTDPQTGTKRGCAQVRVEEEDYEAAVSYTRRLLCDPHGVYVAEATEQIIEIQQNRERNETGGARGPSHAVVIEKRRNTNNNNGGGGSSGHHHHRSHHHHHHHHNHAHHHPPPHPLHSANAGGMPLHHPHHPHHPQMVPSHGFVLPPPPPPPLYTAAGSAGGGGGGVFVPSTTVGGMPSWAGPPPPSGLVFSGGPFLAKPSPLQNTMNSAS